MCATCALLILLGSTPVSVIAQRPTLSAFADDFLRSLSARDSISRGALVIVNRSGPVVSKAFGRTAAGDVVDPARTIFRAASNSKLFVTTAALQLAERGRWRLDDDVNGYLPPEARLGPSPGRAVTIADLLTQTSGLEVKFEGAIASAKTRLTLAEFYARHTPSRNAEPGRDIAYSNTGMALAGYLVERASGIDFATYVQRNIFAPLGMTRFIQAQLAHGATASGRILDSASVELMQTPHWRAQADAVGVAYGFFEGIAGVHRYLFHTGDSGDHSLVLLVPTLGVGLYFVYSGRDDQASIRERLAADFLDRFAGTTSPLPRATMSTSLKAFTGSYRAAGFSGTNYEKLRSLAERVRVGLAGSSLAIDPPGAGPPVILARVSDFTFHGDSGEIVAFQPDADGVVRRFTLSGSVWDPRSWDRIRWYENRTLHLTLFAIWLGTVLLRAIIIPPAQWIARRRRSRAAAAGDAEMRRWWRASGIGAWLILLAPAIGFARAMTSFVMPAEGITKGIHTASLVAIVGALLMLVSGVTLSVRRLAGTGTLIRPTAQLMTVATLAGLILIGYWRLLPV